MKIDTNKIKHMVSTGYIKVKCKKARLFNKKVQKMNEETAVRLYQTINKDNKGPIVETTRLSQRKAFIRVLALDYQDMKNELKTLKTKEKKSTMKQFIKNWEQSELTELYPDYSSRKLKYRRENLGTLKEIIGDQEW